MTNPRETSRQPGHETHRPTGQPRHALRAAKLLVGTGLVLFVVGAFIGLVLIGRHGGGALQGWDDAVGRWLLHHRGDLAGVSRFFATWLDAFPLGVLCALISIFLYVVLRSPRALIPFVAYLGAETLVFSIRAVIHRPRPLTALYPAPGSLPGVHETSYSFPSGHATAVTAVLFALLGCVALTRKIWWPWLLAAVGSLFVADTRLVLGVHWLSDVVVGMLLGAAWGIAVAVGVRWVEFPDLAKALRPSTWRAVDRS